MLLPSLAARATRLARMQAIGPAFVTLVIAASLVAGLTVGGVVIGQDEEKSNPYLAPADYSQDELVEYLGRLQRKPMTIQKRPAFIEAVADAAERVLKAEPKDEARKVATLALFDALHGAAVLGDTEADARLMAWAEKLKDDSVKEVAAAAGLHVLEKRLIDAREEGVSEADAAKLLADVRDYLSKQKLAKRHLRLASESVGLINDTIKDAKNKDAAFDTLGEMLVKSADPDVARYGKSILKKPKTPGSSGGPAVGKPIEIAGKTLDGKDFDLKDYKGKVVLVDFWATWCGPCVREMPNVKANYEKYHKRGFEVVGISLDRDREKLDAFIAENEVPWANLFENARALAKQHGIRAIPAPILVGKDGTVISKSARGEELGRLLEKHLAEAAE